MKVLRINIDWRKSLYRTAGLALGIFLLFLWIDFLFPANTEILYSQTITDRDGDMLHAFLARDEKWRMKANLDEITPELIQAIIHKEDRYFYWHTGINVAAILRAFWNNTTSGHKTSGASTITMQVARLLEPKSRTYLHKAWEVFRAFQLEWHLSKQEILALYLNLVPYGSNVEGVKAASILYLGRPPSQLSLSQSVALTVIPNRPTSLALGRHNDQIVIARDKWLHRFEGLFAADMIQDALEEPFVAYRREAPKLAPHYAWMAKNKWPWEEKIISTIDASVQSKAEKIVHRYAQFAKLYSIHNASALVIDNRTREILAYVGSPDFGDHDHAGQVNGIKAYRSPGSTLKPFVYGMAFDLGLATPKKMVTDVPIDYEGYSPENFDKQHHGLLSIETALASSLNTIAVKTLAEVGVQKFVERLSNIGFRKVDQQSRQLGLSVALGGCGVSLEELATAYAALANRGKWLPLKLKLSGDSTVSSEFQAISPGSAYMVTEILSKIERPDFPNNYQYSQSVPKVAWKTGTSYGRRDAWSVGYNSHYTVAVWLGNFDNHGSRQLTGAGMATPLLFKLFDVIDHKTSSGWLSRPDDLDFRYICAESGDVPEEYCTHQTMDWFLPEKSSFQRCTHMKYQWVSEDEKMTYCTYCLPTVGYKKELYPNHPPDLIGYFQEEGIPYLKIPDHNPTCPNVLADNPPKITSPMHGRAYHLLGDATEVALEAQTANDVAYVYWYINDRFLQKVKAGDRLFFTPTKGQTKISCTDDRGRNTDIRVTFE